MALFGEIVEPTSRSTWEDWDDDFEQNECITLNWSKTLDVQGTVNNFIILEGRYLSNCIKSQSPNFISLVNSIDGANLNLYKVISTKKETYICTVKEYNLLFSSEIVELLKLFIEKSDNVLSILIKPLSEYQSVYPITKSCITRIIRTTKVDHNNIFDFNQLEQPNIVSGISAGVTCLREHQDLAATILIYYVEHNNDYQIEEINNVLEKLEIIQNCKKMLNNVTNNNLYI